MHKRSATVGIISDTHGLLRPEAMDALAGSALIIHAGDVGDPAILTELQLLAPVVAVRGNVDRGTWAMQLPMTEVAEFSDIFFYILHDIATLDLKPASAGMSVVVYGHSHQPLINYRDSVLYLNPGSAGPRRFRLPVTLARVTVTNGQPTAELVSLFPQE